MLIPIAKPIGYTGTDPYKMWEFIGFFYIFWLQFKWKCCIDVLRLLWNWDCCVFSLLLSSSVEPPAISLYLANSMIATQKGNDEDTVIFFIILSHFLVFLVLFYCRLCSCDVFIFAEHGLPCWYGYIFPCLYIVIFKLELFGVWHVAAVGFLLAENSKLGVRNF